RLLTQPPRPEGGSDGLQKLAFSPDGKRLATTNGMLQMAIWDVVAGRQILTLQSPGFHFAWGPDGRRLASTMGDDGVKLWDTTTGQEVVRIPVGSGICSLAWSTDGKDLMAACATGEVFILDTGKRPTIRALSPDADLDRGLQLMAQGKLD